MTRKITKFFFYTMLTSIVLLPTITTYAAYEADLAIYEKNIRFSKDYFVEAQKVRIYATVENIGTRDGSGTVKFIDKETASQIQDDQPISVIAGKTDDVFVDWIAMPGTHTIIIHVNPWSKETDNPNNNNSTKTFFVDYDTDRDGIGNQKDTDDDNDGISDADDLFPLNKDEWQDTDGDQIGNNQDDDDDNDGVKDEDDAFPLDPNEYLDTDSDGIGDNEDDDDDNDGLTDEKEEKSDTDPKKIDTDDDLIPDKDDEFPLDKKEWTDFDGDGIGDNEDPDDDNDGLEDELDLNDKNKGPEIVIKDAKKRYSTGKNIVFDASASYDQDGEITNFRWQFDKKEEKEGEKVNYIFKESGKHTVSLTVTDDQNESRTKNYEVNIINTSLYMALGIILLILLLLALCLTLSYISKAKNCAINQKIKNKIGELTKKTGEIAKKIHTKKIKIRNPRKK